MGLARPEEAFVDRANCHLDRCSFSTRPVPPHLCANRGLGLATPRDRLALARARHAAPGCAILPLHSWGFNSDSVLAPLCRTGGGNIFCASGRGPSTSAWVGKSGPACRDWPFPGRDFVRNACFSHPDHSDSTETSLDRRAVYGERTGLF